MSVLVSLILIKAECSETVLNKVSLTAIKRLHSPDKDFISEILSYRTNCSILFKISDVYGVIT